jgi:hypothetical protein
MGRAQYPGQLLPRYGIQAHQTMQRCPDSAALAKLEAVLVPAVTAASKGRGQMRKWSSYTFQYQGRNSLLGKPYVFVNAFCGTASVDVRTAWVEVLDGGTCYFSAKYDPKSNRVYDVQVNGFA